MNHTLVSGIGPSLTSERTPKSTGSVEDLKLECDAKMTQNRQNRVREDEITRRKMEEIRLSPMTKALIPTEISEGQHDNKYVTKKFDYTAIADRLRTVRWSTYSHPTGVVYRFYMTHLPTDGNSCVRVIETYNTQIYVTLQ